VTAINTGGARAGGLVGSFTFSIERGSIIANSYATGHVTATANFNWSGGLGMVSAGGLIGDGWDSFVVDSYAFGAICQGQITKRLER